jgi:hypothetical protein
MPSERTEALARHLARAAGHDPDTTVTGYEPQQLVAPQAVYAVSKDQFPVWMTYVLMAEAALAWMDADTQRVYTNEAT